MVSDFNLMRKVDFIAVAGFFRLDDFKSTLKLVGAELSTLC